MSTPGDPCTDGATLSCSEIHMEVGGDAKVAFIPRVVRWTEFSGLQPTEAVCRRGSKRNKRTGRQFANEEHVGACSTFADNNSGSEANLDQSPRRTDAAAFSYSLRVTIALSAVL